MGIDARQDSGAPRGRVSASLRLSIGLATAGWLAAAPPSAAQAPRIRLDLSSQAVVAATRLSPAPGGGRLTEAQVEQPLVMVHAAERSGKIRLDVALDFEGLTMPAGVAGVGTWGEGFVDRRHPHTYVHQIMLSATHALSEHSVVSAAAGKGFVSFGTDDPMNRPVLRFPVNHHWAQVLERAVVVAGVRLGPAALEGAVFNGDEPERPGQWPNADRFGDSWSGRLTVRPVTGVEAQLSRARIRSPEHRDGAGLPQDKWRASARVRGAVGAGSGYLLAEWARTVEADGFFVFTSALAEVQLERSPHRVYYRFERTSRPEEPRAFDLSRSVRPHLDDAILGITRWSVHTVGYAIRLPRLPRWLFAEPMTEVALGHAAHLSGAFRVEDFYGRATFASVTVGLRLRQGPPHRMGRYGVMREADQGATGEHVH